LAARTAGSDLRRAPQFRAPIVLADPDGLEIARHIRPTQVRTETCDRNVLAVALFLVNRRPPMLEPEFEDEAVAFQAEMEVDSTEAVIARADLSGLDADDVDARIADLHYRDVVDWAVGHNVPIDAEGYAETGACRHLRTCWLLAAFVPRLIPGDITGVELGMEALAALPNAAAAQPSLEKLPRLYRDWIDQQQTRLAGLSARRRDVATALLAEARMPLRASRCCVVHVTLRASRLSRSIPAHGAANS
jgi:hypothetical protein